MDVFEAVRTLLAVRSYRDEPVPEDIVRSIVESAHLTASSINLQPWHFVVVEDRDRLKEIGDQVRTGGYVAGAAFAIAVAYEKSNQYGVSDASRAIQDMMLTAWDAGVGSNWTGFGGLDGVAELLGIPDTFDVLAVVPFGYPAQHIGQGKKKRKPLREVVSREKYGRPFE
jgi:nitroreductase